MLIRRNAWVAECACEDGVEFTGKQIERSRRQRNSFVQKLVGAPVKVDQIKINAVSLLNAIEHTNRLRYDLGTYPISRDHSNAFVGAIVGIGFEHNSERRDRRIESKL